MQFLSCQMTFEETAINFLTRLEQKTNEARNYDITISERKFLWVLLNNMKHHKYNKERIASFLTTFELNPSSISQRWIENKSYSLIEERMHLFRNTNRFHIMKGPDEPCAYYYLDHNDGTCILYFSSFFYYYKRYHIQRNKDFTIKIHLFLSFSVHSVLHPTVIPTQSIPVCALFSLVPFGPVP